MRRRNEPARTPGQRLRAARNLTVAAALASGLSLREVADAFGLSRTRVHEIRRALDPGPAEKPNTPFFSSRKRAGTCA